MKLTSDMGSDDLGADVILEKTDDVLVVLVPLLEPEVELGGGDRVETSELQGKVGGNGRGGWQGQEGGDVGSNLESNPGPERDLHDRRGPNGRRVGGGGIESRGERLGSRGRGGIRRVDGNGGDLWNRRESGGAESGEGHGRHGGDASGSWLTSRGRREETGGRRTELDVSEDRAAPARRAPGFPTLFSDGAENGDVNVTVLIDGHLRELLGERDHGGKGLGKRGAGQENLPSSFEERQLVDLGETGEEEGQPRAGGGRDELGGDKGVRRKGDNQGGFNGGQVDPETVDLHKILGGRHYERSRDRRVLRKDGVCRELVAKAGDQRPRSIIVKINRGELKKEVRGEREAGRMGVLTRRKRKEGPKQPEGELQWTWWH